ncbi:hypothetical protein J2X87_000257 [Pseudomonas synxantha]|uniref:Uncharacterized protein n=1 Tax=Pseudomonas synxantha TaxID=47883 RepID=A0ACC6JG16_9PSED|nr:hypothetical protein [Pseudomonas synxantha]
MHTQNCDIMQIFRIMCKGLYLEIFLIQVGVCRRSKDRSLVAAGEACVRRRSRREIRHLGVSGELRRQGLRRLRRRTQAPPAATKAALFQRMAALLRWACFRYRPNSRAGNGLL